MDKEELKQMLKDNLSVKMNYNEVDEFPSLSVTIEFDGEKICEENECFI